MTVKCPICATEESHRRMKVAIADSAVLVCRRCQGYFLYPPLHVEYQASSWSEMRADKWEKDVEIAVRHARAIGHWFAAYMGRPARHVLEIGCGSGFMGKGFAAAGIEYVGIDVDVGSVEAACSRGIAAFKIAAEDYPASQLGSRKFDLVISSNALEHVTDPPRAFAAVKAAVGGVAVLIVPNPEGFLPRLKANPLALKMVQKLVGNERVIAYTLDGYWHNIAYSRAALKYLASAVNLKIERLRTVGINDKVFGFVQRNESLLYRSVSGVLGALDMDSQLIMVAR